MKLYQLALVMLVCSAPLARASVSVNAAALPKGVTLEKANLMAAALDKVIADQTAKEQAQRKELRQTLDLIQKPYVDQFNKTVSGNLKYKTGYDDYVRQAKAIISNTALSPKETKAAISTLAEKYKALFQEIFKAGAIDEVAYFSAVKNAAAAHHKKYKPEKVFSYRYPGFLTLVYAEVFPASTPPTSYQTTISRPFPITAIGGEGGSIDPFGGIYSVECRAGLFQSQYGGVGMGGFLVVPAGYRSIEVSTTLAGDFEFSAFSAGGGSWADGSSAIVVQGEGGTYKVRSFDHGSVSAPLFWYDELSGQGPWVFTTTFSAPPANTNLSVSVHSWASAFAYVGASSHARVMAGIATDIPIRIRFIP